MAWTDRPWVLGGWIFVGVVAFSILVHAVAPAPTAQKGTRITDPTKVTSPPKAGHSYMDFTDWQNKGDEDLEFCVVAKSPTQFSDALCWPVEGGGDRGWFTGSQHMSCWSDMTGFTASIWTVNTELVNSQEFVGNYCHGDDHSYHYLVTANYIIDVSQVE